MLLVRIHTCNLVLAVSDSPLLVHDDVRRALVIVVLGVEEVTRRWLNFLLEL